MLGTAWRLMRRSDLLLAGLAIGIAGVGRIALNSLVGFGFGPGALARYATAVASIMLWSGLANAGPSAAITLSVARRWGADPGRLPSGLLRFLAALSIGFLAVAIMAGALLQGSSFGIGLPVWAAGVSVLVAYQVGRALGYATQSALLVTAGEGMGAILALASTVGLMAARVDVPTTGLVLAYLSGPGAFLLTFWWAWRRRVMFLPGKATTDERRLARRASGLFSLGAGSSMALQYLPVLIAGRISAPSVAAVLFGALQATAPLLLLSRVYGTVMMPAFASREDDDRSIRHLDAVRSLFLPTLALGLGLAPWVVVSLGLTPDAFSVTIATLVAVLMLMQVWATPAVTILSSRRREWIPALSSFGGLLVAAAIWVGALRTGVSMLLPVGLVVGGVVRSLVPMWIFAGRPMAPRTAGFGVPALGAIVMIGWSGFMARQGPSAALLAGAVLLLLGGGLSATTVNAWRKRHAYPPRQ